MTDSSEAWRSSRRVTASRSASDAAAAERIALAPRDQWLSKLDGLSMDGYYEKGDTPDKRLRFLAGKAVDALKGRAPAKDVVAELRNAAQEEVR